MTRLVRVESHILDRTLSAITSLLTDCHQSQFFIYSQPCRKDNPKWLTMPPTSVPRPIPKRLLTEHTGSLPHPLFTWQTNIHHLPIAVRTDRLYCLVLCLIETMIALLTLIETTVGHTDHRPVTLVALRLANTTWTVSGRGGATSRSK